MSLGQVFHVDVVADAGTVTGVVVGAKHAHAIALARHTLTRNLDQVRSFRRCLTQQTVRIGPSYVEVTQDHVIEG